MLSYESSHTFLKHGSWIYTLFWSCWYRIRPNVEIFRGSKLTGMTTSLTVPWKEISRCGTGEGGVVQARNWGNLCYKGTSEKLKDIELLHASHRPLLVCYVVHYKRKKAKEYGGKDCKTIPIGLAGDSQFQMLFFRFPMHGTYSSVRRGASVMRLINFPWLLIPPNSWRRLAWYWKKSSDRKGFNVMGKVWDCQIIFKTYFIFWHVCCHARQFCPVHNC